MKAQESNSQKTKPMATAGHNSNYALKSSRSAHISSESPFGDHVQVCIETTLILGRERPLIRVPILATPWNY